MVEFSRGLCCQCAIVTPPNPLYAYIRMSFSSRLLATFSYILRMYMPTLVLRCEYRAETHRIENEYTRAKRGIWVGPWMEWHEIDGGLLRQGGSADQKLDFQSKKAME